MFRRLVARTKIKSSAMEFFLFCKQDISDNMLNQSIYVNHILGGKANV